MSYQSQRCSLMWHWKLPMNLIKTLSVTPHWSLSSLRAGTAAAAAESLQSCLTLCDPRDGSPPGSAAAGILQAAILEWVAISFPSAWKWNMKVKSILFTTLDLVFSTIYLARSRHSVNICEWKWIYVALHLFNMTSHALLGVGSSSPHFPTRTLNFMPQSLHISESLLKLLEPQIAEVKWLRPWVLGSNHLGFFSALSVTC